MKELLQQALTEARAEAIEVFTSNSGIAAETKDAIEYMHSLLNVYFDKQALAQQDQPTIKESSTVGQDISSDEFLSVRLGRVAKLVGVEMPDMTHQQIVEVAGTILGQIASKLEKADQPAVEQSILDYTKGIYDFIQSIAPAGTADEAFRLPETPSRNQRQIQDFVQGHASRFVPPIEGQDTGYGRKTEGNVADQPAQEPGNYKCLFCEHEQSHGEIECGNCGRHYPVDAPVTHPAKPPLSDEEINRIISESDLLDMFKNIGWYSAPKKRFMEHSATLIRAIEAHIKGVAT